MSAHVVTIGGVTATVPEHARRAGIARQLLRYRLRTGVEEARLLALPGENRRIGNDKVAELRRRVAAGEPVARAARAVGISQTYAREIVQGRSRKATP